MKYLILLILLFDLSLFASNNKSDEMDRKTKHIQEQIEREKKYSIEQQFYKGENYDLKSAEVNPDSVKNLPDVENTYEGYDMTDDYDDN